MPDEGQRQNKRFGFVNSYDTKPKWRQFHAHNPAVTKGTTPQYLLKSIKYRYF